MPKPAFTIKVFGCCLLLLGPTLIAVPNLLLGIFQMPAASEVWIRLAGVLVSFSGFAALGLISRMLNAFATMDVLGGVWTHLALRGEARA